MDYTLQFEITRKTSVVIVDNDPNFIAETSSSLLLEGYILNSFNDLCSLSEYLKKYTFDIGIFSLDMNESGVTHFLNKNQFLRNKGIIFTTQKNDQVLKVIALKEGADHCLIKPFLLEELSLLTLNLAVRLNGKNNKGWILDRKKWELISPEGKRMKLTNLEQLIVEKLATRNSDAISKEDIAVALGYSPSIYDFRRLEVIIRRLRNKAKLALGIEVPLKTAHRRGYAFTDTIRVVDF